MSTISPTAQDYTKAPKPEATRRVAPKGINVAKHYLRWFVREHGPHIARRAVPTVEAKAASGAVVLSGSKVDVVTAEGELQNYWRQLVREFEAWRQDPESSYAVARKADRDAGGVPWGKSSRRDEEVAWIASFTSDYRPSIDLI